MLSEEKLPGRSEKPAAICQKSSSLTRSGSVSASTLTASATLAATTRARRRKAGMIPFAPYEPSTAGPSGGHRLHGLIRALRRGVVEHRRQTRVGAEDGGRAREDDRDERGRALSRAASAREPRHFRN